MKKTETKDSSKALKSAVRKCDKLSTENYKLKAELEVAANLIREKDRWLTVSNGMEKQLAAKLTEKEMIEDGLIDVIDNLQFDRAELAIRND